MKFPEQLQKGSLMGLVIRGQWDLRGTREDNGQVDDEVHLGQRENQTLPLQRAGISNKFGVFDKSIFQEFVRFAMFEFVIWSGVFITKY